MRRHWSLPAPYPPKVWAISSQSESLFLQPKFQIPQGSSYEIGSAHEPDGDVLGDIQHLVGDAVEEGVGLALGAPTNDDGAAVCSKASW